MKLQIICAAVRSKCGQVIRCHRHFDGIRALVYRGLEMRDQGFIASDGIYYGRRRAYLIQLLAGIKSHDPGGYRGRQLFSEDVY